MAFLSLLSEDIQRYVIQSWVLPEKASTSAVLKLWSRLDRACCNHGLQPYLRSPYPWQMRDTGVGDRHALGIGNVRCFCRWITARGLSEPATATTALTLPMVDRLVHLPESMKVLRTLARLCPNVTTVEAASDDDFSSEHLEFLTSVGWGIRLDELDDVEVLQRIGLHVVDLYLSRSPFDSKVFIAIALHCPNLRIINLTMPKKDELGNTTILILYLLSKCKLCEELSLQEYGDSVEDVAFFCEAEGHSLKRVNFAYWNDGEEEIYMGFLADLLVRCPFLDYVRIGTCSFDRNTKTLRWENEEQILLYDNDWVLFKQCAGTEHLTIVDSFLTEGAAEILSKGLGAHLLTLNLYCHSSGASQMLHSITGFEGSL